MELTDINLNNTSLLTVIKKQLGEPHTWTLSFDEAMELYEKYMRTKTKNLNNVYFICLQKEVLKNFDSLEKQFSQYIEKSKRLIEKEILKNKYLKMLKLHIDSLDTIIENDIEFFENKTKIDNLNDAFEYYKNNQDCIKIFLNNNIQEIERSCCGYGVIEYDFDFDKDNVDLIDIINNNLINNTKSLKYQFVKMTESLETELSKMILDENTVILKCDELHNKILKILAI